MRQRKTYKMNTKKRKNRITLFKTGASLYSKLKIEFLLDFSLRTCFHCVYFGQLFDSVLTWVEMTLAYLKNCAVSISYFIHLLKSFFRLSFRSFQPLSFYLPVSARRKKRIIKNSLLSLLKKKVYPLDLCLNL